MGASGATTTGYTPTDAYYTGTASGIKWNAPSFSSPQTVNVITFRFPTAGSEYQSPYSLGNNEPSTGFAELTTQMKNCARQAFIDLGKLLDVTFTEVTESGTHAVIRVGRSSLPGTAYGYYPSNSASGGDVWLGTTRGYTNPLPGNYHWYTIYHEIGHALGLKHGDAPTALPTDVNAMPWSIMEYKQALWDTALSSVDPNYEFPHTYMMYDVRSLQAMYGTKASNGDTTYLLNPTTAVITEGGVDRPDNSGTNYIYDTINDTGGIDTIDTSAYSTDQTINLGKQEWSNISADQLPFILNSTYAPGNFAIGSNTVIENVTTGSGDDTITGNSSDNAIDAGAGTDAYICTGNRRNYNYVRRGGTLHIFDNRDGSPDGSDTLVNVESIQFTDETVDVSTIVGARIRVKWA